MPDPTPDTAAPLVMAQMQVLPGWIDYNGHMTESRYLFASSETTDAFLRHIGAGMDYVAAGTATTPPKPHHASGRGEAGRPADRLGAGAGRRRKAPACLHPDHRGGEPVATLEQMLLHVDMTAGRACPAAPRCWRRLLPIAEAHAALPRPRRAGRHVGQRKS
jgi:carnitine 3-dehydrogenase